MDEQYLLTTPENVPISYELAGVGSRFVAVLLDSLIISAVQLGLFVILFVASMLLAITSVLGPLLPEDDPDIASVLVLLGLAVILLLSVAVLLGYSLLFEVVWNGQTPGKRMVGIRVVRDDGSPITATAAVIRNVIRLVDFLPAYYIMGVIVMLIDRKGRRLGDMAAGTICVKERRDVAVDRLTLVAPEPETDEVPAEIRLDRLGRLSYDDYHLVKEYLLRRGQLASGPAHNLAVQIADQIAVKLGLELADESAEDFLARVGAALERRGKA